MSKIMKYLLFTFISAYFLQIIASHDFNLDNYAGMMSAGGTISFCMFMPAVGTFIAGANIRSFGWKPDFSEHKKLILLAWLLPTVTQLLGAVLYYLVFPDEFDTTGIFLQETNPETLKELENSGNSYISYVIKEIFYSFTSPNIIISVFLGLGEEIGWRGFLFPELKNNLGRIKGLLLGGVIHGAWHFPLMLLIGYEYGKEYIGAPLLGLFAFCVFTTATGIVSDFLYEKSECIWLPAIFHGSVNSSFNPYMLNTCEHGEHSVFGPVDIGLISVLPMLFFALNILYCESRRESTEIF